MMQKDKKKKILEARLQRIKARGKYVDFTGVVQKLERQIRNLER
jgi:hypothetical protein